MICLLFLKTSVIAVPLVVVAASFAFADRSGECRSMSDRAETKKRLMDCIKKAKADKVGKRAKEKAEKKTKENEIKAVVEEVMKNK